MGLDTRKSIHGRSISLDRNLYVCNHHTCIILFSIRMRETIIFSLISARLTEISLTQCRSQLDFVLRSKAFLFALFSSLIHFKHFISTAYKHICSDIVIDACQGIPGYTKTVVSESIQRTYHNYIKSKIKYNKYDNCSSLRKEIVCAGNLPACIDGTTAFLCRDNCLSFFDKCPSPFFYGNNMCMEFPRREGTGKESPICKQTHWPRSENWQLPEITNTPTPTPGTYVSHAAPLKY